MSDTPGKAMNLPARREGPHSRLWRTIYREAQTLAARAVCPCDVDDAAEWLWRGIAGGWIGVSRDRDGIDWGRPDPWLRDLVSAEADRHLAMAEDRGPACSPEGAGPPTRPSSSSIRSTRPGRQPREERRDLVKGHIWRFLASGWARVRDDRDAIVFWHPSKREFVPFTAELAADYRRLFKSLKNLREQVARNLPGGQPYTGRRPGSGIEESRTAYTGRGSRRRPSATGVPTSRGGRSGS